MISYSGNAGFLKIHPVHFSVTLSGHNYLVFQGSLTLLWPCSSPLDGCRRFKIVAFRLSPQQFHHTLDVADHGRQERMNLCPIQPAVTALSQATIPGQIGYLLFNLITIAVSRFPFFSSQPFSRLPEIRLVVADVYPSSRSILHASRL